MSNFLGPSISDEHYNKLKDLTNEKLFNRDDLEHWILFTFRPNMNKSAFNRIKRDFEHINYREDIKPYIINNLLYDSSGQSHQLDINTIMLFKDDDWIDIKLTNKDTGTTLSFYIKFCIQNFIHWRDNAIRTKEAIYERRITNYSPIIKSGIKGKSSRRKFTRANTNIAKQQTRRKQQQTRRKQQQTRRKQQQDRKAQQQTRRMRQQNNNSRAIRTHQARKARQQARTALNLTLENECPICFFPISREDAVTTIGCGCKDIYHSGCLQAALERSGGSCPMCRTISPPSSPFSPNTN